MGDKADSVNGQRPSLYRIFSERQLDFREHVHYLYQVRTRLYGTVKNQFSKYALKGINDSIFNLEFCPADDTAYAVKANRMVLVYDPRIYSPSRNKPSQFLRGAHEDCVNCITFLGPGGNTFATCSDDCTIKIWDRRNLREQIAHLRGHTNWVKNIEYDPNSNLLFSIAFYDGVRCWDMNRLEFYSGTPEVTDNLVFKLHDPVRMRISPDRSKMFISIRNNVCLVVDEFDGATVHEAGSQVSELLKNNNSKQLHSDLRRRRQNRPSLHTMSGLRGRNSFRAVMSADFHPSSDFIALRHIDVRQETLSVDLTTLYDLTYDYSPFLNYDMTAKNYIRYIDEWSPEEAQDYIKEISFSKDGRILASPNEGGVRLLAMDQLCTPFDLYLDKRFHSKSKALNSLDFDVIQTSMGHTSPVLTCRFAHHDLLVGTGCLNGRVAFHKPQI